MLADFKTSRPPPDHAKVPGDEAAQVALYVALLRDIYPGRPVEALLVWTSGPVIRHLGEPTISAALASLSSRPAQPGIKA